jgi:16S rRNA (cytosine1407-C5)-methyltransferase
MGKNKKKNQNHDKGLPEDFLTRLTDLFGPSLSLEIKRTFVERPTTFRVNTIKGKREEVLEGLQGQGFKVKNVPWYRDAFILQNKTKRELTESKLYSEGKIYIQSLASMVPPLVLDPKPGEKVLDLTAAPGSTTSQIAALMQLTGELIANDNNKPRFFKLKHNMEALGVASAVGPHPNPPLKGEGGGEEELNKDGGWKFVLRMEHGVGICREYPEYFDKILLDAPCSAEARFIEGDIKTYGYWSERKIKEMAYKQRQLLLSAWTALKPGGTLVYSTCTFSPEENEIQIDRLLERNQDAKIAEIDFPGVNHGPIVKSFKERKINEEVVKKALRIMPTSEIEGFFVAKIKKSE